MEKQVREIIAQNVGGTYEAKQKCAEEILRLFSVSTSLLSDQLYECEKCNEFYEPDESGTCPFCGDVC